MLMFLKMAPVHLLLLFAAITQVRAAPNDINKLENIARVSTADESAPPVTLEDASISGSTEEVQGQRQKRLYNFYGYGFPPMNPVIYPNYPSRDDPYQSGFGQDPFAQIYRRLQEIAGVVRNPSFNQPPPPPLPIPFLFPVIYVPQIGCGCSPNPPATPPTPTNGTSNDTDVGISNRWPDMEDDRQNWGLVVDPNETEPDDGQEEDFVRPISFDPILPNRTMTRPPPEVEHGSNQEGSQAGRDMTTTTTTVPPPRRPASSLGVARIQPTACDAAVLSCCHQPQVTYDCFVVQGCPDPTSFGNPCDSQVILGVINKYQRFYGGSQALG